MLAGKQEIISWNQGLAGKILRTCNLELPHPRSPHSRFLDHDGVVETVEAKVTRHTGRVHLVHSKSFSLVSEVLAGAESETIDRRGMEMTQRNQHGFRLALILGLKRSMLCALILDCLPVALFSQSLQYPLQDNAGLRLPTTPDSIVVDKGDPRPRPGEKKVCSIQPFPGMSSTASVTSLQIPSKAQKEYEHACAALKNKKLPEAEQHLRKATEIHPEYVAGWVMLGQTLETRQQTAETRDACSRASSADPNYLPA
jgi:hypothetical protein